MTYETEKINVRRKLSLCPENQNTETVNAYLVAGKKGVFAVWVDGDIMHFATGDDGYWVEVASYHKRWAADIVSAIGLAGLK